MSSATLPTETDVLVVGAGPAGSAAAAWLARAGLDVVLADATTYPRDKTCGDGLTPRAVHELSRLGLEDWLRAHTVNQGLRAHGFGQTLHLPWPGGSLPAWGSAVARTELDDHLRTTALKAGAMDFVKKPVGPIQLLARVDSALRISLATRARRTSKDVGVITA